MNGRKRLLTLLPLLLLTLLTLSAFDNKATNACLEYHADVELTGILKEEIFPGPPEWESVERGDKPLAFWILHLDKPICMNEWRPGDLIDPAEKDIDRTKIVPSDIKKMYKKYKKLLNKRIKVTGELSHKGFGSDLTTVVIEAKKIELAP